MLLRGPERPKLRSDFPLRRRRGQISSLSLFPTAAGEVQTPSAKCMRNSSSLVKMAASMFPISIRRPGRPKYHVSSPHPLILRSDRDQRSRKPLLVLPSALPHLQQWLRHITAASHFAHAQYLFKSRRWRRPHRSFLLRHLVRLIIHNAHAYYLFQREDGGALRSLPPYGGRRGLQAPPLAGSAHARRGGGGRWRRPRLSRSSPGWRRS